MDEKQFCWWLEGFLNRGSDGLGAHEVLLLKQRLSSVFQHVIDPSYPNPETLQQIHDGGELHGDYLNYRRIPGDCQGIQDADAGWRTDESQDDDPEEYWTNLPPGAKC